MRSCMIARGLQPLEAQITKGIQLWESTRVRHGVMIVGQAFAGKTTVCEVLCSGLTELAMQNVSIPSWKFVKTHVHYLNPKAMERVQLYGFLDDASHDWYQFEF